MVVAAAAADEARQAAEIALVLTERGLGGNDADLAHRLDVLRHDRSRRAKDALAMATRWAQTAGLGVGARGEDTLSPRAQSAFHEHGLRL